VSGHSCSKCTEPNPWLPKTLGHDIHELGLAWHQLFWTVAVAARLPEMTEFLAKHRWARWALVVGTVALLGAAFLTADPSSYPPEQWRK
jgi:hypothetical protein